MNNMQGVFGSGGAGGDFFLSPNHYFVSLHIIMRRTGDEGEEKPEEAAQ